MPLNAAAAFAILPQLAAKAGEHPPNNREHKNNENKPKSDGKWVTQAFELSSSESLAEQESSLRTSLSNRIP